MKHLIIIAVVLLLAIGIIAGFYIYNQIPRQQGANNPEICKDTFVGPLSQSQLKYCEAIKHNG